jgi:hypothetical protein
MNKVSILVITCAVVVGCRSSKDPLADAPTRSCGELMSYGKPRIEIKGQDIFSIESTHTFRVSVDSGLDSQGACYLDPSALEYHWASTGDAKDIQSLAVANGPSAVLTPTRLGDYYFSVRVLRGGMEIGEARVQAQATVPERYGFIELRGAIYDASKHPCCPSNSAESPLPKDLARLEYFLNGAEQNWQIHRAHESLKWLEDMREFILVTHGGHPDWLSLTAMLDAQIERLKQVALKNER